MIKYVVEQKTGQHNGIEDFELLAISDSYDEADSIAMNRYCDLSVEEQKLKCIHVGEITEQDLEDKNDWSSYRHVVLLTEYVAE